LVKVTARTLPGATFAAEICDAMRDNAGFSRARPGEDQHRTVDRFDRLALRGVQRAQVKHRARSLVCEQVKARLRGNIIVRGMIVRGIGKAFFIPRTNIPMTNSEHLTRGGNILLDLVAQSGNGWEFYFVPKFGHERDFQLLTVNFAGEIQQVNFHAWGPDRDFERGADADVEAAR
jgi:hypothetical protein